MDEEITDEALIEALVEKLNSGEIVSCFAGGSLHVDRFNFGYKGNSYYALTACGPAKVVWEHCLFFKTKGCTNDTTV